MNNLDFKKIFDNIPDGIYIVDRDRKILYWNKEAENITGWKPADVVGKGCFDNILEHIDKDGHKLCNGIFCPTYQSIKKNKVTKVPFIAYAKTSFGKRIPLQIKASPIHNNDGSVIGSVEVFRDISEQINDLRRAEKIQRNILKADINDDRLSIQILYHPFEFVGGDYYQIEKLDDSNIAFMIADITAHGIAPALYTTILESLWVNNKNHLKNPEQFLSILNNNFAAFLEKKNIYFGTGLYGLFDLENMKFKYCNSGAPPFLCINGKEMKKYTYSSSLLGLADNNEYVVREINFNKGDYFFFFTDGAFEVHNKENQDFGIDGIGEWLKEKYNLLDNKNILELLEKKLLQYSKNGKLMDDVTMVLIGIK